MANRPVPLYDFAAFDYCHISQSITQLMENETNLTVELEVHNVASM